jgi:hypothetical protein
MPLKLVDHDVPDFTSLVAAYPAEEFASPTRSTVPLLAFWAQPESRFAELGTRLGLSEFSSPEFCFEYPVPVQQGSGKPSFTDLMITAASTAIAIEGKYTEPPYEAVNVWLGKAPPSNRKNREIVLAGWLQLIARAVGVTIGADAVTGFPYQLIHRTASACHPNASQRWVVYQLFSDERVAYYRSHLGNLCHLLGRPAALRFGLLVTPPELTSDYMKLTTRWASGERDLSNEVRGGLLSGNFFKFGRVEFSELVSAGSGHGVAG